jgi:hypothetical protein
MPLVVFTGVTVKVFPVQTEDVIEVTEGEGLTVTVTLNVVPLQEPAVGVTTYTTFIAAFVVFVSVPLILVADAPEAVPVTPVTDGADHE